jgi:uncharacterized membrane protein YhdT
MMTTFQTIATCWCIFSYIVGMNFFYLGLNFRILAAFLLSPIVIPVLIIVICWHEERTMWATRERRRQEKAKIQHKQAAR